jgi:hypothetical protein
MKVQKQLSIFLANKPGVLGNICEEFAKHEINILGLTVSDTVDHSVVRLLTSDPQKATTMLGEAGVLVVQTNVLVLDLADRPGALAELSHKLARAKVTIEYAYGTTSESGGNLVLRVSDTRKALQALAPKAKAKAKK